MIGNYFDRTIFVNPLYEYFKWLGSKLFYQTKYWGSHIRIGYGCVIRRTVFGKYNFIGHHTVISDTELGDFTYLSFGCVVTNVTIGKFCSIGPNVQIAPGKHPSSRFVSTHPSLFSNPAFLKRNFVSQNLFEGNARVTVGNDVWIGANSLILDGVKINDGAIVAANSVVTKDVCAYHIVGGSPAKTIKKRFEDDEIEKLLECKWWEKGEDWIAKHIESFADIKDFMKLPTS